jgi:hypothetical protein
MKARRVQEWVPRESLVTKLGGSKSSVTALATNSGRRSRACGTSSFRSSLLCICHHHVKAILENTCDLL